MSGATRTVVLVSGKRKRTYPVPYDTPLQDEYTLGGVRWTVVAVIASEDIEIDMKTLTVTCQ